MQFREIVPRIIDVFPENEGEFHKKLQETGSIDELLTDISLQIMQLMEENGFDMASEDSDVRELNHVLKNTSLRVEKNAGNLKDVYFGIDVTRSSLRRLFLDENINS